MRRTKKETTFPTEGGRERNEEQCEMSEDTKIRVSRTAFQACFVFLLLS